MKSQEKDQANNDGKQGSEQEKSHGSKKKKRKKVLERTAESGDPPNEEDYSADTELEPKAETSSSSSSEESTHDAYRIRSELEIEDHTYDPYLICSELEIEDATDESDESEIKWRMMQGVRKKVIGLTIELSQAIVECMTLVSDTTETLKKFQAFRSLRTMGYYGDRRCVRNNIVSLVDYTEKIIRRIVRIQGGWRQVARGVRRERNVYTDSKINEIICQVEEVICGLDHIVKDFYPCKLNLRRKENHVIIGKLRDFVSNIEGGIETLRTDRNIANLEIEEFWEGKITAKINRMAERLFDSMKWKTKNKKSVVPETTREEDN